jgi:hypothetical protein
MTLIEAGPGSLSQPEHSLGTLEQQTHNTCCAQRNGCRYRHPFLISLASRRHRAIHLSFSLHATDAETRTHLHVGRHCLGSLVRRTWHLKPTAAQPGVIQLDFLVSPFDVFGF